MPRHWPTVESLIWKTPKRILWLFTFGRDATMRHEFGDALDHFHRPVFRRPRVRGVRVFRVEKSMHHLRRVVAVRPHAPALGVMQPEREVQASRRFHLQPLRDAELACLQAGDDPCVRAVVLSVPPSAGVRRSTT